MAMKQEVTLIVPVYNAAKWLRACLESIAAQTYSDIRVIIVDDGSIDGSLKIARDFCGSDPRVELVQSPHGGVSKARNIGIDMATSKYIGFVDADDLLYPDAIQVMMQAMASTGSQVVITDFKLGDESARDFSKNPEENHSENSKVEVYDYEECMRLALYQHRIFNNPWGMLMERSLLGDNVRFREGIRYEDLDAFYRFYENAYKIAYIPEKLYYYRQQPTSFLHTWTERRLDALDVTDRIVAYMRERHPSLLRAARDRQFSAHFNILLAMRKNGVKNPEVKERCLQVIRHARKSTLMDKNVRMKNKLGAISSYAFTTLSQKGVLVAEAVISVLFGLLYFLAPYGADDPWYLAAHNGGNLSQSVADAASTCWWHWQYDVGRLSVAFSSFFLTFCGKSTLAKIIFSLLTAFAIWGIYALGPKIAKARVWSLSDAVWILAVSFLFPWLDYIVSEVYAFNYVWALSLGLLFLNYLSRSWSGVVFSKKALPWLFLLGLLAGWIHEGFSVPLFCGICIYYLTIRTLPDRQEWFMIGGLSLGILIITLMPAFWFMQGARPSHLFKTTLWESIINLVAYNCATYLYIAVFLLLLAVRSSRRKLLADRKGLGFLLMVLTFGIVSTMIYIKYFNGPRTGAFSQMMSVIGLISCTRYMKTPSWCHSSWVRASAVSVALVLSLISVAWAIPVQCRLTDEYNAVEQLKKEADARGTKSIFFQPSPISLGPDFLKPTYLNLNTDYALGGYHLLPPDLKDFEPNSREAKPCAEPDFMIYRNHLVYLGPVPEKRIDVLIQTNHGEERSRTRYTEFQTPSGRQCTFVRLHSQTLDPSLTLHDARIAP